MIEYILDYLANRGIYAASQGEQQQMEDGIARYLQENGLKMATPAPTTKSTLATICRRSLPRT